MPSAGAGGLDRHGSARHRIPYAPRMADRLHFEAEVPIPIGNLALYRRIYVLEHPDPWASST
jgi:hypothetical protein